MNLIVEWDSEIPVRFGVAIRKSPPRGDMKLLLEILYAPYSVVKGLIITMVHFFRPKATLQYPDERWELPEGYRGIPSLPIDPNTGTDKCIACGACARICPEQIITVESETGEDKKRKLTEFTLNASRCMWCGLCVEVCPPGALVMSKEYELATDSREGMIYKREDMHRHGGEFPPEPEEPEEAETSDQSDMSDKSDTNKPQEAAE